MATYLPPFEDSLPWSDTDNDRRFVGIVAITVFATLMAFVLLRFIPLPVPDSKKANEQVVRLIKLQLEKKQLPKPTPPPKPTPTPVPDSPKPKPKQPPKPVPTPKPKPPEPTKQQIEQAAREKAAHSGLLAEMNQIADLRNLDVNLPSGPLTNSGKNARSNASAVVITSKAAQQSSGGINTNKLSRSIGDVNLSSRTTTDVKSTIKSGAGQAGGGSSGYKRGQEEVELMFQQNRASIDNFYNRALRSNPTLKGKLVLELTIAPDGHVTHVRILSSELKDPELEQKIVAKVKSFRFEPRKNVEVTTVTYPIDFLPS
ncbi:MAG: energy transducer TonB [Gammaproteobacteria bacterium]|nr:energy transducer TonB [Gammaproteobacteria bacterium]